ncbi:hypothetical protein [Actinoplanes sp. CA-252034]|uniref:hypothetical protein n=1 Tax=Actinoplanes sp. CA-252034 TaxID=3239906 RepID=UPI003D958D78
MASSTLAGPAERGSAATVRGSDFAELMRQVRAAGYLTAVMLVLSPLKAAVFIVVQQALFGLYLGCSFAPNHKGIGHRGCLSVGTASRHHPQPGA